MDRCLGEPLPHQLANPTQAHLQPPELWSRPDARSGRYAVLATVSGGYPPVEGRLPTRYSPVRHFPLPEGSFSFDLHVLSPPPAFVLSQDQTLRSREFAIPINRDQLVELRSDPAMRGRTLFYNSRSTRARPRSVAGRRGLAMLPISSKNKLACAPELLPARPANILTIKPVCQPLHRLLSVAAHFPGAESFLAGQDY
jgi:hypothetical protein